MRDLVQILSRHLREDPLLSLFLSPFLLSLSDILVGKIKPNVPLIQVFDILLHLRRKILGRVILNTYLLLSEDRFLDTLLLYTLPDFRPNLLESQLLATSS